MYFDNTIKEDIAIPIIDTLIDRDDTRYRDNVIKKYIKFKNYISYFQIQKQIIQKEKYVILNQYI